MDGDRRQRALDHIATLAGSASDLTTLWGGVTEVLADAVPFYWTPCYYTIDPTSLLVTSHYHHGLAEFPAEWLQQEYDGTEVHTIADVVASPSGVTTLHEVTGGDPRATRRWQQNIELGGDQEMLARLQTRAGDTWGALGLYREPDRPMFDDDDKAFLRAAAPTIAEGVRRALLLGEASDPEWPDSPGLLILDGNLRLESASPGTQPWLDAIAEDGRSQLPEAVQSVASAALAGGAPGGVVMARVLARTGIWVVLHGAPLRGDGEPRVAVILESASHDRILPVLMAVYGLSEREKQTVALVLKGLSTQQIASRMFVSTYTVQQHLTSIFDKVGVHSRGELVARLFFTHYEPRFRDNEARCAQDRPMRGGPAAPSKPT